MRIHIVSATPDPKEKGDLGYGNLQSRPRERSLPMLYHQITFAERYTLGVLRRGGLSPAAIARTLGRHRSTILREVQRNQARSDGTYRPPPADCYPPGRRSRSRPNRHFPQPQLTHTLAPLLDL